ncbi:hypothetical protein GGR26_001036 [Lewinella marina]|uniref:Uncharacterized protein n=1 Tax=Neolewinella marina TaxID=438751 RepID=A0A2G0CI45_9BACT|nr:hypothetical protein [Neolewinella marina]NJB85291.1 hypothetical protein [Neolewinella marina]PHK99590.1 hypothetical protein CGL56_00615 [Neolewinella marina]
MRWILLLLPCFLAGQSERPLDAAFRFADGVYLSHATLLANAPEIGWADVGGEMVQLPEDHRLQIDGFHLRSAGADKPSETPYAVALEGEAYLFVEHDARRGFHEFAGLQVVGRFSTVTYDTTVHLRRLMKAYNPATGTPFREGWVERDQRRTVHRVVDMTTGERLPLDRATVQRLVTGESDLESALEQLADDSDAKLRRALEIYNKRHPLLLPPPQANR